MVMHIFINKITLIVVGFCQNYCSTFELHIFFCVNNESLTYLSLRYICYSFLLGGQFFSILQYDFLTEWRRSPGESEEDNQGYVFL